MQHFYRAIQAFADERMAEAAEYAERAAAEQPERLVYAHAARALRRIAEHGRAQVYVDPAGFAAFIRGGGNVPLYEATSAELRRAYLEGDQQTLLDVGVGDGLALLPALTPNISHVDLIEPSEAMLSQTAAELARRGLSHTAFNGTLQNFSQEKHGTWDIIQATYSLHSLPSAERPQMLRWLRDHGRRLLLVEFDPPSFPAEGSPEHVAAIVERYERGLAEYDADRDLVSQGFLMPVMLTNFDRSVARILEEQPIAAWADQLREAGFEHIDTTPLYDYWWARAYLVQATPHP